MPRARDSDKPRGRKTAYSYFIKACHEGLKEGYPNEPVVFKEFSRRCSEKWKIMTDLEKQYFHEKSEKDKVRYDKEMKEYRIRIKGKSRSRLEGEEAPRRPLSAFFWFCDEKRRKVKEDNPGFSLADVSKRLGQLWGEMQPEEKKFYQVMAERDKARYNKEIREYKKRKEETEEAEKESEKSTNPEEAANSSQGDGDDDDDDDKKGDTPPESNEEGGNDADDENSTAGSDDVEDEAAMDEDDEDWQP